MLKDLASLIRKADRGQHDEAKIPPLSPFPQMPLARGRVHELTGTARHSLAALTAGVAQKDGPVFWLRPDWCPETLCPQGLAPLLWNPSALIMVRCTQPIDILWGMEEILRSGCAALVIGEVAEPLPDLRQTRRLHLAAADGATRAQLSKSGTPPPTGLILANHTAQSRIAGVESRWALHHCAPAHHTRKALQTWRLDRLLMRGLPPKDWQVTNPQPMDLPLNELTPCP